MNTYSVFAKEKRKKKLGEIQVDDVVAMNSDILCEQIKSKFPKIDKQFYAFLKAPA